MHEVQKRLLSLGSVVDLNSLTYREICDRVNCKHASQAQHHIGQLVKNGYLLRSPDGSLVVTGKTPGLMESTVLSIPVLGEADCGEATKFATDSIQGYLRLSANTTSVKNTQNLYALIARGSSMNKAKINGKTIEDSDYVLVERRDPYDPETGHIVVSIIDGVANIKRFQRDDEHERVILHPVSSDPSYLPIIIANEDLDSYHLGGKVVDVIKGISNAEPAF